MKQIHVAWTTFQRRQVSMAPHCDFELLFLPIKRRTGLFSKGMQYVRNGWQTLQVLREKRADVVWIQLPQVPLLWVALAYRILVNRKATIIADCHNKMFRRPWSAFPLGVSQLKRCDVVLVHNDDVMDQALALGVPREKLSVVEDPPASFEKVEARPLFPEIPRPWLVFPASFNEDEPLVELMQGAAQLPEMSFLITGNTRNCRDESLIRNAPKNVHFVGFLPTCDFDSLIMGCDAVIALTKFDGIQLSVCGEAVGAGKPMVVSDTSTLRRLFPAGSVFVKDTAEGIASGAKEVMGRLEELKGAVLAQRDEITGRWRSTRGDALMETVTRTVEAKKMQKGKRKVLAVASGGGHWVQLMRLRPAFEGMSLEFIGTNAAYAKEVGKPIHTVRDANMWDKISLAIMFLQVALKVLRVRPDVIVTTGAAPGFAALLFGKLIGARTIWIDSIANSETMSSSGKHARRVADLWLTQWEHLATPQGPHYIGSVL
ncbi:hypothetical protein LPW11_13025 [Geomonas sp. RF6]|uniref:glycosyltransferase n=1 Tax=Geomonas sp. RF6 TaxID=2897342 RepID=UPI001E392AD3|nr:glycosyltransferase [Geomonas sp. RF6]UFS68821.1 hypothetical protein LPW11_13025 [Geomonas sp. RF6]